MKKRMIALTVLIVTSALGLTGCYDGWHQVEGNYNVSQETRQLPAFSRVINEGNFDVYIIQDDRPFEVLLEAESNLIPLIRTRVQGSALIIDTRDGLRNHYPMKLYVHAAEITEASLSGSGLIHADNLMVDDLELNLSGSGDLFFTGDADDLNCSISGSGSADVGIIADEIKATISGSGDMEFWGSANKGDFRISGSGDIRAYDLILKSCYANISGSGNMYLTVEEYLEARITGSGNIYYMGNPVIQANISGSGKILHP